MNRLLRSVLVVSALAIGCGQAPGPTPRADLMPPERFAQVFGDLILARIETLPDTAAFYERRRQILINSDTEIEDLRAFVQTYGGDSDRMAAIYRRIRARVDTLATQRARSNVQPATPIARDSLIGR